eukprot:1915088-Pleurochrysis_carterae.AAC.1
MGLQLAFPARRRRAIGLFPPLRRQQAHNSRTRRATSLPRSPCWPTLLLVQKRPGVREVVERWAGLRGSAPYASAAPS